MVLALAGDSTISSVLRRPPDLAFGSSAVAGLSPSSSIGSAAGEVGASDFAFALALTVFVAFAVLGAFDLAAGFTDAALTAPPLAGGGWLAAALPASAGLRAGSAAASPGFFFEGLAFPALVIAALGLGF